MRPRDLPCVHTVYNIMCFFLFFKAVLEASIGSRKKPKSQSNRAGVSYYFICSVISVLMIVYQSASPLLVYGLFYSIMISAVGRYFEK